MTPKILLSGSNSSLENYEQAISAMGGTPVSGYCPAVDLGCDGLLLCGGSDVAPQHYGQGNLGSRGIDPDRDTAEFALISSFIAAKKPILAICRGHQIINIALGGTLIQDLSTPYLPFHVADSADKVHPVRSAEESFFHKTYGPLFHVNSSHHQAVDRLGDGLRPVLWSEGGIVEGMEHESLPILCVQFHPERMSFAKRRADTVDGAPIFQWFLGQCKK